MFQSYSVAFFTFSGYLRNTDILDHGGPAKWFALINGAQMHLNRWYSNCRQGIPDGIGIMSVGPGINQNSIGLIQGLVNPINNCSLMV